MLSWGFRIIQSNVPQKSTLFIAAPIHKPYSIKYTYSRMYPQNPSLVLKAPDYIPAVSEVHRTFLQLVVFDEADLLFDRGNQGNDTQDRARFPCLMRGPAD